LLQMSLVTSEIQSKNLSRQIDIQSDDSVGHIVDGINSAVRKLRMFLVETIKISRLIEEIISKADNRDDASSPVDKIEKSIEQVTNISECMEQLSGKIIKAVQEGMESANSSSEKLSDTTRNVNGLSELIYSLVKNAEQVHNIVELINSIAQETNILSINAAIEAARAGTYGKSFAVVASEVKNLAGNVSNSVNEITGIVCNIQGDINSAIVYSEKIIQNVNDNNKNSKDILHQFEEIVSITHSNVDANVDLSKSVNQLNLSFEEIHHAFNQLAQNTSELITIAGSYKQ
jgi:methyl-accepting chemotaxis protein